MILHQVLPLFALLLNVCLAVIAFVRNPRGRLNRLFAAFVTAMAVWNLGVFMLRRTADPAAAHAWEIVIHVGVTTLPAVYYHFVLAFLGTWGASKGPPIPPDARGAPAEPWRPSTPRYSHRPLKRNAALRRVLAVAYALSAFFGIANLAGSRAFIAEVQWTPWGWAPAPGVLYQVFLVYFYAYLIAGLLHLRHAYANADSGFRRNRILLVLIGTAVTVLGSVVDISRFALADVVPALGRVYPVGIPSNMLCALMLGLAIVRYRMFGVSVLVKKTAAYGTVSALVTALLIALTWTVEETFALKGLTAVWIITPLGFLFVLLLTPVGRPLEDWIDRLVFSKRRGCHETLVALSRRMGRILDFDGLVETLVRGLVRGIPVTHCALLLHDPDSRTFVTRREETSTGEGTRAQAIRADSPLVSWLERKEGVLVKEEVALAWRPARALGAVATELEALAASIIVPLKVEGRLSGMLLLGEKLSGEIFDAQELELLSVLANQAAIALENARLYARAKSERRRVEILYRHSRRLATVQESDDILALIVEEARSLLGADVAALRLLERSGLVLRASTDPSITAAFRPCVSLGESLSGAVAAADAPVAVEDVLEDARYDPAHRRAAASAGLHGFLGVPLRAGGRVTGVLYAYTRERRRFTPDEVSLLAAFADQASVSVEKSRLTVERRQTEEALRQSEKLATMGRLLAGVAHQLNNPLLVMVGHAGMLRARLPGAADRTEAGTLRAIADQIEDAAQHCTRVVRNFLALAPKHPPERRRLAINGIVTEAVEVLADPFAIDDVKVSLELVEDLPELRADPQQLKQMVVNLLTNAQHAMRQVAVRHLTLSTRWDAERGRVVLRVADSGPGVPREIQARVFEPLFTTKPAGEGSGLGLALCHAIVESHGGLIRLESEPGRGAVFSIELPVEPTAPTEPAAAERRGVPPLPRKTVLVVGGDPAVARLLSEILVLDGHRVDAVPDAAAALERMADDRYDLIISDIRTPRLDGPGLYEEVTRRTQGRQPFVFVAGDRLDAESLRFLEATKAPYLSTPFGVDDVRRTMQAALASVGPAAQSP